MTDERNDELNIDEIRRLGHTLGATAGQALAAVSAFNRGFAEALHANTCNCQSRKPAAGPLTPEEVDRRISAVFNQFSGGARNWPGQTGNTYVCADCTAVADAASKVRDARQVRDEAMFAEASRLLDGLGAQARARREAAQAREEADPSMLTAADARPFVACKAPDPWRPNHFCGLAIGHRGKVCRYVPADELPASADDEGEPERCGRPHINVPPDNRCAHCGEAIALVGDAWYHDVPDNARTRNHIAEPANLTAAERGQLAQADPAQARLEDAPAAPAVPADDPFATVYPYEPQPRP